MDRYEFVAANGDTCEICISGTYTDGTADLSVMCGDYYEEHDQVDAGCVDDVFSAMYDAGVRFESRRSALANVYITASVLLDGDATVHGILERVAAMSDDDIAERLERYIGTADVTP